MIEYCHVECGVVYFSAYVLKFRGMCCVLQNGCSRPHDITSRKTNLNEFHVRASVIFVICN
jgi:hypothetical protein